MELTYLVGDTYAWSGERRRSFFCIIWESMRTLRLMTSPVWEKERKGFLKEITCDEVVREGIPSARSMER